MGRHSRLGNLPHKTLAESSENGPRKGPKAILTKQKLLTDAWRIGPQP